jgi:hypothetical protein
VLIETRRHTRELQSQREIADRAEISRIQDLRSFLESQLQTLAKHTEQSKAEISAHLDRLEGELRRSIEQCQNSLLATLAEIDDRLQHDASHAVKLPNDSV